jgi:hypothetical protein
MCPSYELFACARNSRDASLNVDKGNFGWHVCWTPRLAKII